MWPVLEIWARIPLFVLLLEEPSQEAVERLRKEYHPDRIYSVSDTAILVSTSDSPHEIAAASGIKGDSRIDGASGIVMRLGIGYSGYADKSLWKWMNVLRHKRVRLD